MACAHQSETIDLSALVTALESLLSLAKTQRQREAFLPNLIGDSESGQEGQNVPNGEQHNFEEEKRSTESQIRRKLIEIHSRLKNGAVPWDEDEDMVESDNPTAKMPLRQRAASLATAIRANPAPWIGPRPPRPEDDEDGEDEGTVSDPSPSPQVVNPSSGARQISHGVIGPGKESAKAIIEQCVTVFDGRQGFQTESKALAAQLLAELAKTEVGRFICLCHAVEVVDAEASGSPTTTNVVKSVAQVLGTDCPLETAVQVCRILANLCYDCAEGRRQILSNPDCLRKLVEIVKGRDYRARACGEDPGQRLPAILPGFLLNFCNETPDAIHAVGKLDFLDVIAETVLSTDTNDAVFNNCLLFLNCLVEEKESHPYLARCKSLAEAICHVMQHTTSPEVTESALDFVQGMSDTELVAKLAESHLCTVMMERIEGRWKTYSAEFQDLRNTACNLLVLILAAVAESFEDAFADDENSSRLRTFVRWLKGDDEDLVICACLCIGNFACNETSTKFLVKAGASEALIRVLSANIGHGPKVVMACLGAIKNLILAKSTRDEVLAQGLLDPCTKLVLSLEGNLSDHASVAKLLGILRISIDGRREALDSLMHHDVRGMGRKIVGKLVGFSSNNNATVYVQAEATRFLAALLKNCHSKEIVLSVIECGGMPPLVQALHSRHAVMLNEAVIALTLMATLLLSEDGGDESAAFQVSSQLHTDAVINAVKACIKNPDVPSEIKSNAGTLVETLLRVNADEFKTMLRNMNFATECLSEESVANLPPVCSRLAELLKD